MAQADLPKMRALNALRYIVAVLVLLSHSKFGANGVMPPILYAALAQGGRRVTIFFVLSGFVLAIAHLGALERKEPIDFKKFMLKRIVRLYPAYIAALLLLLPWVIYILRKDGGFSPAYLFAFFASHFTLLQAWYPPLTTEPAWLSQGWTLSVQFFFYAIFPFILVPLARIPVRRGLLLSAGFVVSMALVRLTIVNLNVNYTDWAWHWPLVRTGEFLLGVVAGLAVAKHQFSASHLKLVSGAAVALLVIGAFVDISASQLPWTLGYLSPFLVSPFFALALVVWVSQVKSGLLCHPLFEPLGKASYSLYLTQSVVFYLINFVVQRLNAPAVSKSLPVFLLFVFVATMFSLVFHHVIERPLGSFLKKKLIPTTG